MSVARLMIRSVFTKVAHVVRTEGKAAVPAAVRAASHAADEFLKKFAEEFPKERKKR